MARKIPIGRQILADATSERKAHTAWIWVLIVGLVLVTVAFLAMMH